MSVYGLYDPTPTYEGKGVHFSGVSLDCLLFVLFFYKPHIIPDILKHSLPIILANITCCPLEQHNHVIAKHAYTLRIIIGYYKN